MHWMIIGGYVLVVLIAFITPEEIIGIAYDSGGVTTSTITVPLLSVGETLWLTVLVKLLLHRSHP